MMIFGANIMVFLTGCWILFHSVTHLGEQTDAVGTVTIEHIGSVAGAPHLIGTVIGAALVFISSAFSYKIFKNTEPPPQRAKRKDKLTFARTATGTMIATLKNHAMR
jgi:hypothetical protein